jgi:hypothetical protein
MTALVFLSALIGPITIQQGEEIKRKLAEEMWQKIDKMPELALRLEKVTLDVKKETLGLEFEVTNNSAAPVRLDEYSLGRSLLSVNYMNRGTAFTFVRHNPDVLLQFDTKYITLAPKESRRFTTTLWAGKVEQHHPRARRPIDRQDATLSCVYSAYFRFDGATGPDGRLQSCRINGQGTVFIENKQ